MTNDGLKPIALEQVHIKDKLWSRYEQLVRDVVIPYQWEALNDRIPSAEPSHAIHNFKIAAGEAEGEFGGMVFQDSDLAKWLEACAYSLTTHPDAELERTVDEVIDLIEKAQQKDGYLNTYFIIKEPENRWSNLEECHELYCAGHMLEAAVAYFRASGKRKLLDIMIRFVDYIDTVFGPDPEQLKGYPGHQEIELALVKLYQVTGAEKYLQLSLFFINQRGTEPHYFHEEWKQRNKRSHWAGRAVPAPNLSYNQSHLPVREQSEAAGHAVRAVYMYSAMADLALYCNDADLYAACERIWRNIVTKQMYITGAIGSTAHGEAFTFDYDLPNDTVYAETCASIGLIFFAQRMLQYKAKGEYADVMERALYNTVISGMSQDGKHYFYVNPLEVWPEASDRNPTRRHVKAVRQEWFGCSCCPPNVARMIASLGQYMYSVSEPDRTVYTHLFISGDAQVTLDNQQITLVQESQYPWDGRIHMKVSPEKTQFFTLALRVPGWCRSARLQINGVAAEIEELLNDGYVYIQRTWSEDDTVELILDMPVERLQAHPSVRANAGKLAIQRGPLVYCLEESDNGAPLASLSIPTNDQLTAEFDENCCGGAVVIRGTAYQDQTLGDSEQKEAPLYRRAAEFSAKQTEFTAIPYYLWGNREYGEMSVWMRRSSQ